MIEEQAAENGPLPAGEDLERVREIILGADTNRNRLQQAEVDRLRDILFGAQAEEYERRFSDLQRQLEHMATDMRLAHERMAEFERTLLRRMEQIDLDLRKLHDDVRRDAERTRSISAHQQQLITQTRQHEQTLVGVGEGVLELRRLTGNHDEALRAARADQIDTRDQLEQRTQLIRRELRSAEDTLRAELYRLTDRLAGQKTDRKALAGMLMEIATRLETGASVTGLLEGLANQND
ncbi:MAG: hypothetical protein HC822_20370 [Oscillochloris sp.]|nr:hypothetical protein [Oscillochloris sp.]